MGKKVKESLSVISNIKHSPEISQARKSQISAMLKFLETLNYDQETLRTELSATDKAIDRLMHDIEQEDSNASEGFKVYKTLQELRRERRRIKHDMDALDEIREQVKGNIKPLQTACRKAITSIQSYEVYVGVHNRKVGIPLKVDDGE